MFGFLLEVQWNEELMEFNVNSLGRQTSKWGVGGMSLRRLGVRSGKQAMKGAGREASGGRNRMMGR